MIKNKLIYIRKFHLFFRGWKGKSFYDFNPALQGGNNHGKQINLGFSTFGLKIRYMLGEISTNDLKQRKFGQILFVQKNEKVIK